MLLFTKLDHNLFQLKEGQNQDAEDYVFMFSRNGKGIWKNNQVTHALITKLSPLPPLALKNLTFSHSNEKGYRRASKLLIDYAAFITPSPPLSLALTRRKLQRFRLSLSERNLGAKLWDGLFILLFLSRQMSQERRRNKKVSKSKGGEEGKLKSVEFS